MAEKQPGNLETVGRRFETSAAGKGCAIGCFVLGLLIVAVILLAALSGT